MSRFIGFLNLYDVDHIGIILRKSGRTVSAYVTTASIHTGLFTWYIETRHTLQFENSSTARYFKKNLTVLQIPNYCVISISIDFNKKSDIDKLINELSDEYWLFARLFTSVFSHRTMTIAKLPSKFQKQVV